MEGGATPLIYKHSSPADCVLNVLTWTVDHVPVLSLSPPPDVPHSRLSLTINWPRNSCISSCEWQLWSARSHGVIAARPQICVIRCNLSLSGVVGAEEVFHWKLSVRPIKLWTTWKAVKWALECVSGRTVTAAAVVVGEKAELWTNTHTHTHTVYCSPRSWFWQHASITAPS